ncbi:hypothetical protein PV08_00858 [Exophiala spinifera]|uniref:Enoyl reductase (ER) domain-containing protein n=1 Tax=Exophiala spinifera TaxID=91928 RepID=A0A0D2BMW1_9EURO|nr:uncharacterized protein PV08_00858 [Exophiala spinifera]KIW20283.1 hypothetical protein PV08_00858 [Exophiala spinifera]
MTSPQTQKAVLVTEIGKPVTLVDDWPVPQPGPGQAQVKVVVAGINPHDRKARDQGLFIKDAIPAVLTNDVVGEVTALGEGVTKYSLGDHVVYQAGFAVPNKQNGLQQYAVLDLDHSAKLPEGISDDDAATLPTNILAPLVALFDPEKGLGIPAPWTTEASAFDYKKASVLILGGGSNCGRFGVQLASLAGVGRIVVVGGDEAELKSYGATHIVDRHGSPDEVTARIRDVVGDELIYAYDAINPPATQVVGVNALSTTKKGKFARLLPLGPVNEAFVKPKKEGWQLYNVFGSSEFRPDLCKPFWEHLPRYLVEKKIRPTEFTVSKGLSAEKVNEVLDAYRDGKKVTKTHIHVQE